MTGARPVETRSSVPAHHCVAPVDATLRVDVPGRTVTLTGAVTRSAVATRVRQPAVRVGAGRANKFTLTVACVSGYAVDASAAVATRITGTFVDVLLAETS